MTEEIPKPPVEKITEGMGLASVAAVPDLDPEIEANVISSELLLPTEVISYGIEPSKFSIDALKKYANPVNAAKAYGRFVKRTFKRFRWPEVNGTASALGAAYLSKKYGGNAWATAWAGALGEDVGFYGTTAVQRYKELRNRERDPYTRREAVRETASYMFGSFALAETVDKVTRPSLMWTMQQASEHSAIGATAAVGVGKIAADHVYYGVVDPMVSAYYKRAEARRAAKIAAKKL